VISYSPKFDIVDRSSRPTAPSVELRLPLTHRVLGTEVPVTLTISGAGRSSSACGRDVVDDEEFEQLATVYNSDNSPYSLQLIYFKWNSTGHDRSSVEKRETVQTIKLADLSPYSSLEQTSALASPRRLRLAFSCSSVTRPGVYVAELVSSADGSFTPRSRRPPTTGNDDDDDDDDDVDDGGGGVLVDDAPHVALAVSNRMLVTDLAIGAYSMTVSGSSPSSPSVSAANAVKSTVFPCVGRHITVRFTQPTCPGLDDRIRVYEHSVMVAEELREEGRGSFDKIPAATSGQSMVASASLDLSKMVYLNERRVRQRHAAVTFDCDLFRQTALHYCFVYVSATSGADQFQERARVCLQTNSSNTGETT